MEALAFAAKGSPAGLKLIKSLHSLSVTPETKDQLASNILAYAKQQGSFLRSQAPCIALVIGMEAPFSTAILTKGIIERMQYSPFKISRSKSSRHA